MQKFAYQAINESGKTLSGTIEADSAEMAQNILADRGLIPAGVTEAKASQSQGTALSSIDEKLSVVRPPELILFTKQFRTLLQAGVPILQLLQVLENQSPNKKLKKITATMSADIKEGATLYDAFRKHKTFSNLYCSMVRAGESSGALPEVLTRLTYIIEHENRVKSDIKSALQYPATVVIALVGAFFFLLTFVVPKFATVFQSANLELPWPTLVCMLLNHLITAYWYLLVAGIAGLVIGLVYCVKKTERGRFLKDSMVLKIPILGPLFVKTAMSRFSSIFAILQSSGVPVLDSLNILSGTIGNTAIGRQFDRIRGRVEEGRGIAGPLSSSKYFTPMVINMVAIGEESGNLDGMLREISAHYDDEVAYSVKRLSEAIGPVLIVGLAGVVGFFAFAIFLPMWDLMKLVNK